MHTPEQIIAALEAEGFRACFLPIHAMEQVRAHYDTLLERGPDTQWLRTAVQHFREHQPPKLEFEPQSILLTACPRPGGTVALQRGGGVVKLPIPPCCVNAPMPGGTWEDCVAALDCRTAHTRGVSIKLLTVLSGLGQYGRNNICYVGEYGSYVALGACYTDVPYDGSLHTDLRMEACETCDVCRKACPTGAIGKSQVIDASRCLAHANNHRPGRMPRWAPKGAHHTLIECLRCQECCHKNPPADLSLTLALDKRETRRLLSRKKKMPRDLARKFRAFGLDSWNMDALKRNARLGVRALGVRG
jgi:epoxyqueuosine reductase